jgi:hypothetical protein
MSNGPGCQCGQTHGACATEFQYSVKVVCGEANTDTPNAPVAPGQYWTAINIHNPNKCNDAHFRFKLAVAFQSLESPISQHFGAFPLRPDQALEVDCPLIRDIYPGGSPPKFIKGFFVIESDMMLDVVAVYSGSAGPCGANTFSTERVEPRCVPVCEDLVLPLHTGFADWRTVSPTVGSLGPVVAVTNTGWTAPIPFGSGWVSQTLADGANAPSNTTRYYELCFDLCSGYEVPAALPIQVLADDTAKVLLNNQQVGAVVPWNNLTTLSVNPAFLRVGRNCFRVEVTNKPAPPPTTPTGFAVAGILRVPRGKCPCAPLPIVASAKDGPGPNKAADLFRQDKPAAKVD